MIAAVLTRCCPKCRDGALVNVTTSEDERVTYRCVVCDERVIGERQGERGEEQMSVGIAPEQRNQRAEAAKSRWARERAAATAERVTPPAASPALPHVDSLIGKALARFAAAAATFATAHEAHGDAEIVYQAAILTLTEARAELAAARVALDAALGEIGGEAASAGGKPKQRKPEGWVPANKGKHKVNGVWVTVTPQPSANGAAVEVGA